MSFRMVASANGAISLLTGTVALVAPAALAAVHATAPTEREAAVIQLLGAAYIGIGLVTWLLRGTADADVRRGIALAAFVSWASSLVVVLLSLGLTTRGPAAWGNVALEAAFTVAWGYVLMQVRSGVRNAPGTVRA